MRLLLLFAAVLGSLGSVGSLSANFVPPAEKALLFRRDSLTLDDNRQRLLSQSFLALATRAEAIQNTTQRRATAQLLALAINLDPKAKGPGNIAQAFSEGRQDDLMPVNDFETPLQNIIASCLFLLEDPANKEHLAIAQLFLDPLATIAPDLDIVLARPDSEESPHWQGVVAPVEQFITRREPDLKAEEKELMTGENEFANIVTPGSKPMKTVQPFNGSLTIPAFVGLRSRNSILSTQAKLNKLTFDARLKNQPGRIYPPVSQGARTLSSTIATVRANLMNLHGEATVTRIDGKFRLGSSNYLDRNGQTLTLPMTLLGEGFLSERQPLENLLVLGRVTSDGQIRAPEAPWQFLEIFLASESNETRRLLVATELAPLLEAFLTKQQEDFFFDFDIFAVRTIEEAIALSFEAGAPENTSQALAQFEEIRSVGADKKTSVFVTNPHVLSRLDKVLALEPRLLSATLLKKRGKGNYPAKFPSEVLAAQIQSALTPLARIPYSPSRELIPDYLEKVHSECRAKLDPLAKHIALGDRKTLDEALDLTNRIRTLARAKERFDKAEYSGEESFHVSLFYNTFRAIQEEYFELAKKICQILGQKPPLDPRIPKRD